MELVYGTDCRSLCKHTDSIGKIKHCLRTAGVFWMQQYPYVRLSRYYSVVMRGFDLLPSSARFSVANAQHERIQDKQCLVDHSGKQF